MVILLVLQTAAAPALGQAFGVIPQVAVIEARAGSTITLPLSLLSFSDQAIDITLEHKPIKWNYKDSRGLIPHHARVDNVLLERAGQLEEWFSFPEVFTIQPSKKPQLANITVTLPFNASGTYGGNFLIVEDGRDQLLSVGYQTAYEIIISNRPSYRLINLSEVSFDWTAAGLFLTLDFINSGNARLLLEGEIRLFKINQKRRRLVHLSDIQPFALVPGQSELVKLPLPFDIPSGTYQVQISPVIKGKRQQALSFAKSFINGLEFGGKRDSRETEITPNLLRTSVAPGARRNFPIELSNSGNKDIEVSFGDLAWLNEKPKHLTVSISNETLDLRAGQSKAIRVQLETEAGYEQPKSPVYAVFLIETSNDLPDQGGSPVLLEIAATDFQAERGIEISDVRFAEDIDRPDRSLLQFDLRNTGSLAETPQFIFNLSGLDIIESYQDELFVLDNYIGPGLTLTEELVIEQPYSKIVEYLQTRGSSNISVDFRPIVGGKLGELTRLSPRLTLKLDR